MYFLLFAIQVFLFFALPGIHQELLFTVVTCVIALCYGGGFGVMPSFTADLFGSKYVGGIYGWILLGWGFAAIPSPLLIAHILRHFCDWLRDADLARVSGSGAARGPASVVAGSGWRRRGPVVRTSIPALGQ